MDVADLETLEMARMFQDSHARRLAAVHRFIGVSIGTRREMTGLAVMEKLERLCSVRYLERFKPGTAYPDIVARVAEVIRNLPPVESDQPQLVIDITAVGPPVLELFKKEVGLTVIGATMTGGFEVNAPTYCNIAVPKRDLVSTVEVLLQTALLKIAPALEEAITLTRALENFQLKKSEVTADSTSMLWREESEDDLVFAVALACWQAARAHYSWWA